MWEIQVQSLGWEDPLEKEMTTTPVFLPGKSHGQRSLVGYTPWGSKESDDWLGCYYRVSTKVAFLPNLESGSLLVMTWAGGWGAFVSGYKEAQSASDVTWVLGSASVALVQGLTVVALGQNSTTPHPFLISKEPFCSCVVRRVSLTLRMRNMWSFICTGPSSSFTSAVLDYLSTGD